MSVDVPAGGPDELRAAASRLAALAAQCAQRAAEVVQVSFGVNPVWRSVPSAPRATSRLDATADLLRTWSGRLADVATALRRYAAALDEARDAATRINATPAPGPSLGCPPNLPPGLPCCPTPGLAHPTVTVDWQRVLAALPAIDRECAAAITAASGGEAAGTAPVTRRIALADRAADAGPVALAGMLRAALAARPPDYAAVEEATRQLARKQNYPDYLAAVVGGLGPQLRTLIDLPVPDGYDAGELLAMLAVVAADLRAAGRPLPKADEDALRARLPGRRLPEPAYVP